MGQTKQKEALAPATAIAYVQVPRAVIEKLTGNEQEEETRARLFSGLMAEYAKEISAGGVVLDASLTAAMVEVLGEKISPDRLLSALQRGMAKTADGRMVIEYAVDPAYVDDLKNWARAGGNGENYAQYISRGFDWIMKQGWLCGVPTEAISLNFSPDDYQTLCELAGKDADSFTGTDVVNLVRQALEESTPAPFMAEPEKTEATA